MPPDSSAAVVDARCVHCGAQATAEMLARTRLSLNAAIGLIKAMTAKGADGGGWAVPGLSEVVRVRKAAARLEADIEKAPEVVVVHRSEFELLASYLAGGHYEPRTEEEGRLAAQMIALARAPR